MRLRSRTSVVVAATAALALTLTACGGGDEKDDVQGSGFEDCVEDPVNCNSGDRADGGEITWALSAGWNNWNGNRAEGNSVYQSQVLAGIMPPTGTFVQDGTYRWSEALLASEPELVSEEPQTMSYELNPDAVWSDGTPIGIEDFYFTWYSLTTDESKCDEKCDPASTAYGDSVKSIEESDGKIIVTYKDGVKDPEWMYGVPVSYPAHIATAEGFDWKNDPAAMGEAADWFDATVPTWSGGPYLIEDATLGESVTYVPNPKWYGKIKPTLDKLHLVVVGSQPDMLKALENGEIDGSAPESLDPDVAEQAVSSEGILSALGPSSGWEHIDINTRSEWLDDVELRRAIFTAIDVDDVNGRTYGQVTKDVERRTNHLFPNGTPYHEDILTETGQGSGNIDDAKKILEDAGYKVDGDKLTKDGETVGPLTYRYLEGHAMREITATLVQEYLKQIGIEIVIETVPGDQLSSVLVGGEYDIIGFGWSSSPTFANAPTQFWSTSSGSNFGGVGNDEIDEAVTKVLSTADADEAAAYANAAAKMVVDEAYSLPLITPPGLLVVSDKLVNIRDNWANNIRSFYNIEEWGIRA